MIEQLNTLSLTWWSWMSEMFVQVSILIILISGIDLLLRKWILPQVRYALWYCSTVSQLFVFLQKKLKHRERRVFYCLYLKLNPSPFNNSH